FGWTPEFPVRLTRQLGAGSALRKRLHWLPF
ncbi:MAG: hypothetical protein ACI883_000464, partial [Candidatus Azotimanducaceae bacterium]